MPLRRVAAVFAASLAVKLAYLMVLARSAPGGATWPQTQYDAPAYVAIARSFPWFQSTPELAATARWYPFSPLLVRLAALVTSFDAGAVIVPLVASSAAVCLLYVIARRFAVPHAEVAAVWFVFLPPKWFLLGIFPMSEPVYVALALGAALCALGGRFRWFLVLLALTVLTKATAVIFVAVFVLYHGRRHFSRTAWTAAVLSAPLALQVYLALFHGFDRFPLFLHAQSGFQEVEYSTPTGDAFSYPMHAFVEGLTDPSIPWGYRVVVLSEFLVYAAGVVLAWRLRGESDVARLSFLWLACFFVFHLFVYGSLHLAGFRGYTRLMVPAAPALILTCVTALRGPLGRPWFRAATIAAGATVSVGITWATLRALLAV